MVVVIDSTTKVRIDVELQVQILEALQFGEHDESFLRWWEVAEWDADLEMDGADGVFVHGIDDPEIV